ncbi:MULTISPECIES: hypothetical protein [Bacillati]|uniref:Uncharacterized protein n=1 Tax=Cytobacillus horneckiae TaxID=549687 RepID=A0A2N0Z985_9BACI|nr:MULTISPECIES: hypothetical protein [Terrabacteria group]MDK7667365.1 hypothetical protein [Cytobacillus oceanisediminis]MEC1157783.1 hypothetical protein [Cytobacillus horneckiae]PKG26073.1 hypothetical protein CWS20_25875 [Cytobacillus horneckiae]
MIRNDRDKIAKEIATENEIKFIQAQNIIDLFLKLAYEEGYIVIKAKQFHGEKYEEYGRSLRTNMTKNVQEEGTQNISEEPNDDV